MVKTLDTIKRPITEELRSFEEHFSDLMRSKVPFLDKITDYIVKRKGKQVRPMFVLLCAKLCGNGTEKTNLIGASLVEIMHTASLVHDDVVDDSNERRSFLSVNALWKNKVAVLVGDYLFTQGLSLALKHKKYRLLHILSDAVQVMAVGELLQLEKARRLDIKEEIYYDVIRGKTASLFAATCSIGAATMTEDEETIEKMRLFGEKIGIAFQIRDDLFDFGSDDVGKPLGIDIKEKKMTLPLIYALENTDRSTRRRMITNVKRHNEKKDKVREVIDFVLQSGGMEYAKKAMHKYRDEAFEILHSFPPSEVRESLEDLVNFVVERRK